MDKNALEKLFEEIGTTPNPAGSLPGWLEHLAKEVEEERAKLWKGYSFTEDWCKTCGLPIVDMYPTFTWVNTPPHNFLAANWIIDPTTNVHTINYTHFTKRIYHPEDPSMVYSGLVVRSPTGQLKAFKILGPGQAEHQEYFFNGFVYAVPLYSLDRLLTTEIRLYVPTKEHTIVI